MTIYPHPFFKKSVCIFYFLNSNVFAFAIIEYIKFRRPGNFFFPRGKKISWSALALAWEDFLLFLGGGKEVNEKSSTYHAVSICICY